MPRGVPAAGFRMTKNRVAMANTNTPALPIAESRFSINDRFEFVSEMVSMLARGIQPSVIVTGPGGLGKSFTVIDSLIKAGLKDISLVDDLPVGFTLNGGKTFRVIKGYSTPKGLYRTLFENRDGVVVFDDCDSVLKDPVSLNLLKAALDSYDKRIISWRADIRDEDLPTSFLFNGRVVFISNQSSNSIDQAIITRSMAVDLSMTPTQKVERMRWLLTKDDFMPEYEMAYKSDAIDLIAALVDKVKELSLRTLITVTKIRKAGGPRWRDLAEYTIAG
jgi:hypothetical protein